MIEYKLGEELGFIKKAHTRKSVLVQCRYRKTIGYSGHSELRPKDASNPLVRVI